MPTDTLNVHNSRAFKLFHKSELILIFKSVEWRLLAHIFFRDFVVGRYLQAARMLIPKSQKSARPKVCIFELT